MFFSLGDLSVNSGAIGSDVLCMDVSIPIVTGSHSSKKVKGKVWFTNQKYPKIAFAQTLSSNSPANDGVIIS